MPDTHLLPIDAYVVAFDETGNYRIQDKHRPLIESIQGVYLFNKNEVTHCCELTPSYFLIHLYDVVVLGVEVSDELMEELSEEYEQCGGEDIYVHCHTIDAKIKAAQPGWVHHYGATEVSYDESDYNEQMEGLREHFCGNHVL
jgi:hypothetical protein